MRRHCIAFYAISNDHAFSSSQLNTLETELAKIGKERESQVQEFERQYHSMRTSVEKILQDLEKIDDSYNEKIKSFFVMMNSYRTLS